MKTLEKKSLFWDIKEIDPQKHRRFIMERVLNFGDIEDFKWLLEHYGEQAIIGHVKQKNSLDKKSLLFWCDYFNLDKEKCLNNQSTRKQSAFWKR
jgi:hypothetical protein